MKGQDIEGGEKITHHFKEAKSYNTKFIQYIHAAKIFSNTSGIPDFVPSAETMKFNSWIVSVLWEVHFCKAVFQAWSMSCHMLYPGKCVLTFIVGTFQLCGTLLY